MMQLSLFEDIESLCVADASHDDRSREFVSDYDAFVDKFKVKKTTDDCYTPPAVYDAVLRFARQRYGIGEDVEIVRPFYPGGDYQRHQYPDGGVVVDNPPFSVLTKILRFYCASGIRFFLFAPSLTLFSAADCDLTYIVADCDVVYDNGARVRTGFITNLPDEVRVYVCPELHDEIEMIQKKPSKTKLGFVYPDNIVTAATLQKLAAHGTSLEIRKEECVYIRESDSCKAQGRRLFGGGFLLSSRAAAERAAATKLNMSERERKMIAELDERTKRN